MYYVAVALNYAMINTLYVLHTNTGHRACLTLQILYVVST